MSEPVLNTEPEGENKSLFGVIVHSFFVVPFLLAVFSVLLFTSVRILTMESRSAYDYLEDVKIGGLTKRWQSAFELSKILANSKLIPKEERFTDELIGAFEKSSTDDPRVRQYLALAMARTGNAKFVDVLIKNIQNEKSENLTAIIYSLGILKSARSVDVLLTFLNDDSARIRLSAVMALGNIGDLKSLGSLKRLLNDPEPNVQWETAIALAKNNDLSAKPVLLKLLNRKYLSQFSEVDPEEQTHIMMVAIEASTFLNHNEIDEQLQAVIKSDENLKVRSAAFKVLEKRKETTNHGIS